MISCAEFTDYLNTLGIDTAVGVPDSTFKDLISYFNCARSITHIKACNECEAVGIGAGYYLAKNRPALVYMQNSGFGKTVNPYTSLCSNDIYGMPALFLVGWRGKPGVKDEPQHKMIGRILPDLINTLEIPYAVLDPAQWQEQLSLAYQKTVEGRIPFALVLSKGLFSPCTSSEKKGDDSLLLREHILGLIVDNFPQDTLFVSTTGKTSRELFELRERKGQNHDRDFLTVGSMGCASSIAFGIALSKPQRKICIIDGDGAALMQMGSMATIGHYQPKNLTHIIIDNNAHESTGGQPTVSESVDFCDIGKACSYSSVFKAQNEQEIMDAVNQIKEIQSLSLLVIKSRKGARKDLGRPTTTPRENKIAFMNELGSPEHG